LEYKPSLPEDSSNLSKEDSLKDFFSMLIQVGILLFFFYYGLGLVSDFISQRITLEQESKYLSTKRKDEDQKFAEVNLYLNRLKNQLLVGRAEAKHISIYFYCDEESNAFTLPGGVILINSKTLDILKSENALNYIIGHEIGHILNRDIIRGMGRNLIIGLILAFLNNGQKTFSQVLNMVGLNFSREVEFKADKIAESLNFKLYGHLRGSNEFFKYHIETEGDSAWLKFFSTHPSLKDRLRDGGDFTEDLPLIPNKFNTLCGGDK